MRLAIIGGGVVGGGVVEMLANNPLFEIVHLIVNNLTRQRDFTIPTNTILSDNWEEIKTTTTKLDMVVEVMGGTGIAWDITQYCLSNGISMVSANKTLISREMNTIEALCIENKCFFRYEAAVCGGIPIISTLLCAMRADALSSIGGVMNGSTNWMLDRMHKDSSLSYDSLVVEAKDLGYLEADPTADIQGYDARSKLCILIRIAFGVNVPEGDVVCRGIHTVSQADMQFAKAQGKNIKLLARAWREGDRVHAFIAPALVGMATTVGSLQGPSNCVEFDAQFSGRTVLIGAGAGRYPTANSVVADVLSISTSLSYRESPSPFPSPFGPKAPSVHFEPSFSAKFYLRSANPTGTTTTGTTTATEGTLRVSADPPVVVTEALTPYSSLPALLAGAGSNVVSVLVGVE